MTRKELLESRTVHDFAKNVVTMTENKDIVDCILVLSALRNELQEKSY